MQRLREVREEGDPLAHFVSDWTGRRVRTEAGGQVRLFVTDDFEWDGTRATVHVFAAGRRIASRSILFDPPLEGQAQVPPAGILAPGTRPLLLALAVGPPLALASCC
jgi:hypothetical protein